MPYGKPGVARETVEVPGVVCVWQLIETNLR